MNDLQKCPFCGVQAVFVYPEITVTDLEKELADALKDALDDVREVLFDNESRWGDYRKDRIDMKKAQIGKIEALLKRARGE